MLDSVVEITLGMSAVILVMLVLMPALDKRYSARWRYFVWLVIALRLAVPVNITLPQAPVTISYEPRAVPMPGALPQTDTASAPPQISGEVSGAPAKPVFSLYDFLTYAWAAGAVLFFTAHIFSYFRFRMKIKPFCSPFDSSILRRCCNRLNIKRLPSAVICGAAEGPMMTGFFSPVIILPEAEYSEKELEIILTHELTHLKRGDIWYKLLVCAACSIHWFNPLVHIMARFAARDLEYSCDDAVVKNTDLQYRKEYSMAILKSMQQRKKLRFSAYLGREAQHSKKRFSNILNTKKKKAGAAALVVIIAAALLAALGFSMRQSAPAPIDDYLTDTRFSEMKTKLNSLNADAPPKGAVVISADRTLESRGDLDEFLRLTKNKLPAELTVLSYSEEQDPVFINVVYDGALFYGAEDDSRVKNRGDGEEFYTYSYKFLKEYDDGSTVIYYLADDESVTYEDIFKSALSSAAGAMIPHMFVMSFNK